MTEEIAEELDASLSRRNALAHFTGAGAAIGLLSGAAAADAAAVQPATSGSRGAFNLDLRDFGVDASGRNDSSAGFRRALEQLAGGFLYIPQGTYLVEDLAGLGPAGQRIVGESRWRTILRSERGAKPVFRSSVASRGTSAFHLLSDFTIDLNGNGGIAVDLASINATTVERLHITGGSSAPYKGIGVRFASPLDQGAYDNGIYDCTFEYLDRAVVWDSGANANSIFNCRIINCRIGLDAAPPAELDTPRVFGGRVERCEIGLLEGAIAGGYHSVRFEASGIADIVFTPSSRNAGIWGGFTATTRFALKDLDKAASYTIDSNELGHHAKAPEEDPARTSLGIQVFGRNAPPARDGIGVRTAALLGDQTLIARGGSVDFVGSAAGDVTAGMSINPLGEFVISGQRGTGDFGAINIGASAVQPIQSANTDLGAVGRTFRSAHLSEEVRIDGRRVLGRQVNAVANDRSASANSATVNAILAALRAHGLIAS